VFGDNYLDVIEDFIPKLFALSPPKKNLAGEPMTNLEFVCTMKVGFLVLL
jgi:hypothetical protein